MEFLGIALGFVSMVTPGTFLTNWSGCLPVSARKFSLENLSMKSQTLFIFLEGILSEKVNISQLDEGEMVISSGFIVRNYTWPINLMH